ncbi:MAG: InlB B-repeat-containing protein, partial [Firmicutes bacterium]|nr:InlB B-repeat-containing protein [Bacillota bacterium]
IITLLCAFAFAACDGIDTPSAKITVTFKVDGATYKTVEVKSGAELPSNPQKDGFVFVGWFLDDLSFEQPFTDLSDATVSVTVYAKWTKTEPKIAVIRTDLSNFLINGYVSAIIDADHTKFVRLSLNNETVAPSNYAVTAGSTIITYSKDYIYALGDGNHVFVAEFEDGVSGIIELDVIHGIYSNEVDLVIPDGTTIIKPFEFIGSKIKSIAIPSSVTVIGDGAFYGCNLTTTYYGGTYSQWENINISQWSGNIGYLYVTDFDPRRNEQLMAPPPDRAMNEISVEGSKAAASLATDYWMNLKDNPVSGWDGEELSESYFNLAHFFFEDFLFHWKHYEFVFDDFLDEGLYYSIVQVEETIDDEIFYRKEFETRELTPTQIEAAQELFEWLDEFCREL